MAIIKPYGLAGLSLRARGLLLTIRAIAIETGSTNCPDIADPCIDQDDLAGALAELVAAHLIEPGCYRPTLDGWEIGTEAWVLDPGFIYAVWRGSDDAIKIGKSRKPKGRFSGIKGMGLHCAFKLLGYGFYRNMSAHESRLHHVFAAHRLDGEWFAISWVSVREHLAKSESFTDLSVDESTAGGVACQTA